MSLVFYKWTTIHLNGMDCASILSVTLGLMVFIPSNLIRILTMGFVRCHKGLLVQNTKQLERFNQMDNHACFRY